MRGRRMSLHQPIGNIVSLRLYSYHTHEGSFEKGHAPAGRGDAATSATLTPVAAFSQWHPSRLRHLMACDSPSDVTERTAGRVM